MTKEYLIGTSGWNYDHWKGRFYPEGLAKKDWLGHYAEHFNTVEVNYSFYRWPSEKTMKKWFEEAPDDFRFTMKAPRLITHIKRLNNIESKISDFYELTGLLKGKKGCHLFQLPPSFKLDDENLHRVSGLARALDGRKDNAVEFRDKSWWDERVYDLLKRRSVSFCSVSGLEMPGETVLTGDTAYFRFHGVRYSTKYSDRELEEYAGRMKGLKCSRVYAYFNNDARGYAVENALKLKELLDA